MWFTQQFVQVTQQKRMNRSESSRVGDAEALLQLSHWASGAHHILCWGTGGVGLHLDVATDVPILSVPSYSRAACLIT